MSRVLPGPFNHEARLKGGFTQNELAYLEKKAKAKPVA